MRVGNCNKKALRERLIHISLLSDRHGAAKCHHWSYILSTGLKDIKSRAIRSTQLPRDRHFSFEDVQAVRGNYRHD